MNIKNVEKTIKKFSEDRDWDRYHSPKNLVMALSGEVGELNEIFQWLTEDESYNLPDNVKQHTEEEIADIAIYLLKICMKLEINIEDAIIKKMEQNEQKYPIDKIKGKFKKYTEL
jgi:NTP pyrophosphatase (non-canonical NTP hydrolase)